MAYLILVRHGMSEYNAKSLWTGWDDPSLTDEGQEQARFAAKAIEDIPINSAFVPPQKRSIETLQRILSTLNRVDIPITQDNAIKERNYGIYTAKNKWEIQKELGVEEFQKIRRGWDYPIQSGESLKSVYDRVIPYYQQHIQPELISGKNVIIVSSGNALRSLVKHLENIPDDKIADFEIGIGQVLCYQIDANGVVVEKEIRTEKTQVP